jgi:hypothetical protein
LERHAARVFDILKQASQDVCVLNDVGSISFSKSLQAPTHCIGISPRRQCQVAEFPQFFGQPSAFEASLDSSFQLALTE